MATELVLPKLGFSMNDGTLTKWMIKDSKTVTEGQPLFVLESEESFRKSRRQRPAL